MRAADDDPPSQPGNSATLSALLLETLAQVGTLVAERDALLSQNERLQYLLLKLKRRHFGTKSERLSEEQLLFAFEEIEPFSSRLRRPEIYSGDQPSRNKRAISANSAPSGASRGWLRHPPRRRRQVDRGIAVPLVFIADRPR